MFRKLMLVSVASLGVLSPLVVPTNVDALHDGRDDGEWRPLRSERCVIGRCEGDVVIPHDEMISTQHAVITREAQSDRYRWYLTDLESTNGTYVRIGNAVLKHGQEMLIGSSRYRFSATPQGLSDQIASDVSSGGRPAGTRGWQSISPNDLLPSLIQLTVQGEGKRFPLSASENWLGRDARQSSLCVPDDPLLNPRHGRIYRDAKGRWRVENNHSRNGIWIRITKMPLDTNGQFQLGEQRFMVRIL